MLIKLFDLAFFLSLYFYFRQVDPASDNVAANSLQSCMQHRNVRKVDVNAKITFIIWLLEIFSIIVVAVVGVVAGMKETACKACKNPTIYITLDITQGKYKNLDIT